jgi:Putative beta-lactamase-inhibitor-like, PepSY-like
MKKLILIIAFNACVVFAANAQNKLKVSESLQTSFQKMFPSANNLKWEKEGKDFEASFILNGVKTSAIFDSNGNWKETEEAVTEKDIPAKAVTYFKQHYKNATVKETAKITSATNKITYEIGIKGKDILFDAEGNFIKELKD